MEFILKGTSEEIEKLLKAISSERYQTTTEITIDSSVVAEATAKSFSSDQFKEKSKVQQNEAR